MSDGFDKAAFVPGSQKKKKRPWDIPSSVPEEARASKTKQTKPVQEQSGVIVKKEQAPLPVVVGEKAVDRPSGQTGEKVFKPVGLPDMTAGKKEEPVNHPPASREPAAAADESPANRPSGPEEVKKSEPTGQADAVEAKKEEPEPSGPAAPEPTAEEHALAPEKDDTTAAGAGK